jgi:hypothetical protein
VFHVIPNIAFYYRACSSRTHRVCFIPFDAVNLLWLRRKFDTRLTAAVQVLRSKFVVHNSSPFLQKHTAHLCMYLCIYLYSCGLFSNAIASIDYAASNGEMINEQCIGKDSGSGRGLI